MNHTSRSLITATRKRKDRSDIQDSSFYNHKGNFVNKKQQQHHHQPLNKASTYNKTISNPGSPRFFNEPGLGSSNRILAGYMAHEFLSKGTLFGQKFDPARAEAVPVSAAESMRKPISSAPVKPSRSYAEVSQLVTGDGGAHIPGIVNPTQLAKWIQM